MDISVSEMNLSVKDFDRETVPGYDIVSKCEQTKLEWSPRDKAEGIKK